MLSLIKEKDDINKIYLYAKDLTKPKYEFLIKKCEDVKTNCFNDPKKTKFSKFFYHLFFFFCSKRRAIKFKTLLDYDNQQQKRITKYCK